MIEPGVVALLLADPAVAALLGNRIFPLILDEGCARPAASYQLISTVDTYTFEGPVGLVQVRLQIDSWGDTYAQAKAVAAAIRAVLDGFEGTAGNVAVGDIQRDGERGGFDQGNRLFYVQTDWLIWYSE